MNSKKFNAHSQEIPLPPTGTKLNCKGWHQEAALRCLLNNLHPDVAEDRNKLIVYGGRGKAARNHKALFEIIDALKNLEDNETALIQSGQLAGILPSHPYGPKVLIANSNLVPKWSTWNHFNELEKKNLMMYGQMTAGSWIYIGAQGILQGTHETFMSATRKHHGEKSTLKGKLVVSSGLGGMGGAQPLAVTLGGGVFLGADIDPKRIEKRIQTKYLDLVCSHLGEALEKAEKAKEESIPLSIAVPCHATSLLHFLKSKNVIPDFLTDQTSAHDPLYGYIPNEFSLEKAEEVRHSDSDYYLKESLKSMREHVELMLYFKKKGSHVFDYGNNLRDGAQKAGLSKAHDIKGFVPEYIRPLFCEGSGPFRWIALSGDPEDIYTTDRALQECFPENKSLHNWLIKAQKKVSFQGLPARICWLKYGDREKAGLLFNELVRTNKVKAPIVIGRDHLDGGSVASPYRETENMLDGSDAISDWPLLNALINTMNGASWVSYHNGGGVGIGFSQHAGMVIVADGTDDSALRLKRVLNSDPGMAILRHASAGYQKSVEIKQSFKKR